MVWKDEKYYSTGQQVLYIVLLLPFVVFFIGALIVSLGKNWPIWWIVLCLILLIVTIISLVAYNWYRTRITDEGIFIPGFFKKGHMIPWKDIKTIKLISPKNQEKLKNIAFSQIIFLASLSSTHSPLLSGEYLRVKKMLILEVYDGVKNYKIRIVSPGKLGETFKSHNINFEEKDNELVWVKSQ